MDCYCLAGKTRFSFKMGEIWFFLFPVIFTGADRQHVIIKGELHADQESNKQ